MNPFLQILNVNTSNDQMAGIDKIGLFGDSHNDIGKDNFGKLLSSLFGVKIGAEDGSALSQRLIECFPCVETQQKNPDIPCPQPYGVLPEMIISGQDNEAADGKIDIASFKTGDTPVYPLTVRLSSNHANALLAIDDTSWTAPVKADSIQPELIPGKGVGNRSQPDLPVTQRFIFQNPTYDTNLSNQELFSGNKNELHSTSLFVNRQEQIDAKVFDSKAIPFKTNIQPDSAIDRPISDKVFDQSARLLNIKEVELTEKQAEPPIGRESPVNSAAGRKPSGVDFGTPSILRSIPVGNSIMNDSDVKVVPPISNKCPVNIPNNIADGAKPFGVDFELPHILRSIPVGIPIVDSPDVKAAPLAEIRVSDGDDELMLNGFTRPTASDPEMANNSSLKNFLSNNSGAGKAIAKPNGNIAESGPAKAVNMEVPIQSIGDLARMDMKPAKAEGSSVRFLIPDNMQNNGNANNHTITIKMEPEHLGTIRLTLSSQNNSLMGRMVVENSTALLVVESNIDNLFNELSNKGIKLDAFHVSVGGDHSEKKPAHDRAAFRMKNRVGRYEKPENSESVLSMAAGATVGRMYINSNGVNWLA